MQSGTYSTAPLAQGKPDPNLLLPPLSTLTASGIGANSAASSTITPISTPTDSSVTQIMQQAGNLWAEHAPRLKDSSKAAAGQLGKIATTVLHHGEDALNDVKTTMADPSKRSGLWGRYRTIILAGGGGIALLIGLGWAAVDYEASSIADRKIKSALQQAGLTPYVKYSSVSASPFGSVTLHDVQIFLSRVDKPSLKIGALSLNGLSSSATLPQALSIQADSVECPLESVSTFSAGTMPGFALKGLGYSNVTGDVALSYKISGQQISVRSNADFDQMGGWKVAFTLDNVPTQTLNSLATLRSGFSEQNLMLLMQAASQFQSTQVQSATITLNNKGLVKRLAAVPATAFPQETTVPDNAPAPKRWSTQGGQLTITAQQPIPLMVRSGFTGYPELNPAVTDPDRFIAATNATVTLN